MGIICFGYAAKYFETCLVYFQFIPFPIMISDLWARRPLCWMGFHQAQHETKSGSPRSCSIEGCFCSMNSDEVDELSLSTLKREPRTRCEAAPCCEVLGSKGPCPTHEFLHWKPLLRPKWRASHAWISWYTNCYTHITYCHWAFGRPTSERRGTASRCRAQQDFLILKEHAGSKIRYSMIQNSFILLNECVKYACLSLSESMLVIYCTNIYLLPLVVHRSYGKWMNMPQIQVSYSDLWCFVKSKWWFSIAARNHER